MPHLELASVLSRLAAVHKLRGELTLAQGLYSSTIRVYSQIFGASHHDVLYFQKKLEELPSEPNSNLSEEAKISMVSWIQDASPVALDAGASLLSQGQYLPAGNLYRKLLRSVQQRERLSSNIQFVAGSAPNSSTVWTKLSELHSTIGQYKKAGISSLLALETRDARSRTTGLIHAAGLFRQSGNVMAARRLLLKAVRLTTPTTKQTAPGVQSDDLYIERLDCLYQLAQLYYSTGRFSMAYLEFNRVKKMLESKWGPLSIDLIVVHADLVRTSTKLGKIALGVR